MLNIINKKPYEKIRRTFNFANELADNEIIIYATIACINTVTGASSMVGARLADGTYLADGSITAGGSLATTIVESYFVSGSYRVCVTIGNGNLGELHKITCIAVTDQGNYFEKELYVNITGEIDDTFYKQPTDQYVVGCDFEDDVLSVSGDTIKSRTVLATRMSDNSDATSTVIEASAISDLNINVGVMAGSNNEAYKLTVQVLSNNNFKYQKDLLMVVVNN